MPSVESKSSSLETLSPYFAEFVGTFLLAFTFCCCSLVGDPTWNPLAIASILTASIYAFGPVSGGNLNPAVSITLGLVRKSPWSVVGPYVIVQSAAGLAAAFICRLVFGQAIVPLEPKAPFGWWDAMVVEVIYTMMLCFVVANCAASKRNNPRFDENHFFALAIGWVIVAGGYASGSISGAYFNPAISLGVDFVASVVDGTYWGWSLAWATFEVMGAMVAAALFCVCRPEDCSHISITNYKAPLSRRLVGEFLGTFMLVLTVGLNVVTKSPAGPVSAAAALMCMIYSLGDVSGGHFNPAVTVAVVGSLRDKCGPVDGLLYILTQVAAGVTAGCLYAHFHVVGPNKNTTFGLTTGEGYNFQQAFWAEFVFTFVLAFVVLSCATATLPPSYTKGNFYFALAIGLSVIAGGVAVGAITGGELNPAVSCGLSTGSLINGPNATATNFLNCLWFSLYELAGGAAAAAVFVIIHPSDYQDESIFPTS